MAHSIVMQAVEPVQPDGSEHRGGLPAAGRSAGVKPRPAGHGHNDGSCCFSRPIRQGRPVAPDQSQPAAAARPAGCRDGHPPPGPARSGGGQGAGQTRDGPQFLEGQVGLLGQQRPQLAMMADGNAGLAAGAMMLRGGCRRGGGAVGAAS